MAKKRNPFDEIMGSGAPSGDVPPTEGGDKGGFMKAFKNAKKKSKKKGRK